METDAPIKADVPFFSYATLRVRALSTQPKEPSFVVRVTPLAAPRATHAVSASVGRSVSAGAKTGTTRTGWRAAGQGAWSTPASQVPPHVALPCPSVSCHPAHSIRFPDVFSRFTGTSKPAGCRASGWPLGPSVRPSAAAPCRQEHPFPSGRRMHACRLPGREGS